MYPLPPVAKQERLLLNENLNIYIEYQAILNLNQVNLNEMFWNQAANEELFYIEDFVKN